MVEELEEGNSECGKCGHPLPGTIGPEDSCENCGIFWIKQINKVSDKWRNKYGR